MKHKDCKMKMDKVRKKEVDRNRAEAERLLRKVVEECEAVDSKNCLSAFTERCRQMSECPSSQSAGDLAGDLGWLKLGKNEARFGITFDTLAFSLPVGHVSDLFDTEEGIHVFMRTA